MFQVPLHFGHLFGHKLKKSRRNDTGLKDWALDFLIQYVIRQTMYLDFDFFTIFYHLKPEPSLFDIDYDFISQSLETMIS
jgi:hypothetical protein